MLWPGFKLKMLVEAGYVNRFIEDSFDPYILSRNDGLSGAFASCETTKGYFNLNFFVS